MLGNIRRFNKEWAERELAEERRRAREKADGAKLEEHVRELKRAREERENADRKED